MSTLHLHFIAFVFLFLFGLYVTMTHKNLVKKLLGLYTLQSSVILFFILLSAKKNSTVPVIMAPYTNILPEMYANPLPQVLMLTAIVVGVSTLGVSLGLVIKIHRRYKTLQENMIKAEEEQ